MQRMLVQKLLKVGITTDDVFAGGNRDATWLQYAIDFTACSFQICRVMQHRSRKHDIEARISKRQPLGNFLDNVNGNSGIVREHAYRCCANNLAWVRLKRRNCETITGQCITGDTTASSDIERSATTTMQYSGDGAPLLRCMVTRRGIHQWVIVVCVARNLLLLGLISKPDDRLFPGRQLGISAHRAIAP